MRSNCLSTYGQKINKEMVSISTQTPEVNVFNITKEQRLDIINQLIQKISSEGNRHFYKDGNLAEMKFKGNRLYFTDEWTGVDIIVKNVPHWNNFTHGGTIQALILDFADFIRTGKATNGKHGYGGLYAPAATWGYTEEEHQRMIVFAKEIGYLI